jgi:uncharacterized membrane protein HdeD (DUF308 family)
MTASRQADRGVGESRPAHLWWVFLILGILWVLISFVVLAGSPTSVATIGFLMGGVLIAAGLTEAVEATTAEGWRWLHLVLAVLFIATGVLAFLEPFQTFGILALLIGWYLLIKGTATIVIAAMARREIHLWGLLLACGLLEAAIGVWAIGYPGRSAWLLIIWVGVGALLRGITEIVTAVRLHDPHDQATRMAVA